MFGYDYVNLTPEQVEARRKLLDQAGFQAYLAPIFILAACYIYQNLFTWDRSKNPSSSSLTRRISWILNTTFIDEFGPLKVQLLGLSYASLLLFRITYQTGNDYMHVTKAFGHVAVSQLPLHYLLAIKHPKSPITLATGLTHERLNAYHRLFGRIIHTLLATHAILYLRFFAVKDLLPKRIKDSDVRLGIIAFWTLNFIGILSVPPIRAKMYHALFYRSHVLLSALLLLVIWFHVPYTRIYVAQAAVAWVLNGVLRRGSSQSANVRCEAVGENLIRVKATVKEPHLHPYVPGCHVYLNQPGLGPKTPFTVVSAKGLAKGETVVELVAKNSGGPMTGMMLAAKAKDGKGFMLQLEGPYGEAQRYMPGLLGPAKARGKVLLVAGGVGATYALPIFKALVDARGSADGMKLLWVIRKEEEAGWAKDFLRDTRVASGIHLAVTQPESTSKLMKNNSFGGAVSKVDTGRPDLDKVVTEVFKTKDKVVDRLTVMVCGPPGLSKALRTAVGKQVLGHGRDVEWYEEQFGFGGSVS